MDGFFNLKRLGRESGKGLLRILQAMPIKVKYRNERVGGSGDYFNVSVSEEKNDCYNIFPRDGEIISRFSYDWDNNHGHELKWLGVNTVEGITFVEFRRKFFILFSNGVGKNRKNYKNRGGSYKR